MLLQAAESDVVYERGKFSVKNREVSLFEVAERAGELKRQGVIPESLDTLDKVKLPPSFPNGCHVAEVEINPATGATEIVNYVAVGDCGDVLDDTIVEAQIHGGVAQGIGQALTEDTIYDSRRPARLRYLHGLRGAARRHRAADDGRASPSRLPHKSDRRERHR